MTRCAKGETATLVGILQPPCGSAFVAYSSGECGSNVCVREMLSPGRWYLFVAPLNFGADAGPCGQDYVATLDGLACPPCAVETSSWGTVKNLYR